jgi:tRNA A37 threonylcarbamoyladenosine dehydratase
MDEWDSSAWDRRFSGVRQLYGSVGAQGIAQAHVLVVGVGGVGSWCVEALSRSGVGRLTLIDLDHVALSNINRQVQALDSSLGQAKVQALRERIALISPDCQVHAIEDFVTPENWLDLLGTLPLGVDAVIDACDQTTTKVALAAWALNHPATIYVTVGAAGGKRAAHRVEIQDLAHVHHDRLLARVRSQLRKQVALKRVSTPVPAPLGLVTVFSPEASQASLKSCESPNGLVGTPLSCHGYGSSISVTATFGFCAAGWVLDRLAQGAQGVRPVKEWSCLS